MKVSTTAFSHLALAVALSPAIAAEEAPFDSEACSLLPFSDPFAFASEDLQEYKNGIFLVTAGKQGPYGPEQDRSVNLPNQPPVDPYGNGAIYGLVFPDDGGVPTTPAPLVVTGLPSEEYLSSINFRPHGLYIEDDLLFVVSHNEPDGEENVVVFEIDDDDGDSEDLPELVFRRVLASEAWTPVGAGSESWHINDLVVADDGEILVTQFGPVVRATIPFSLSPKNLWSCKFDEDVLGSSSASSEDPRVAIECTPAVDFPCVNDDPTTWRANPFCNLGLNGVTINDDKTKVWANDFFRQLLLEIERDEATGAYAQVGVLPLPGLVDNVNFVDGDLNAGLFNLQFTQDPEELQGGIVTVRDAEEAGAAGRATVRQLDKGYLDEIAAAALPVYGVPVPFVVSQALAHEDYVIFGSFAYPGIVVCAAANDD